MGEKDGKKACRPNGQQKAEDSPGLEASNVAVNAHGTFSLDTGILSQLQSLKCIILHPLEKHLLGNNRTGPMFFKCIMRNSCCGSVVANLTNTHEGVGSIPGLTQWVKDPMLPRAVMYVTDMAQIPSFCGCGIGWQLQLPVYP